jgi:hypothetical protein
MKQTSIEWLVNQFETIVFYSEEAKEDVINQAKEMHKQEIIEARINGHNAPSSTLKHFDAEQYYEMTYGK